MTGFLRFKRKEEIAVASEIKRRFTDTEMKIVRETDLLELLTHLGYQVKRIGRYHTTAEMDSLRIKDRRTWFRYSQNTGGDAITLVQQFCDKTFPEAVEYLLTFNGRARDSPAKAVPSVKRASSIKILFAESASAESASLSVAAFTIKIVPSASASSPRMVSVRASARFWARVSCCTSM